MASHTTTGVTSTSSSSTTSHSASPAPLPLGMPIIALGAESREALAQQARRWADRLQTDGGEGLLDALRDTPTIAQYPCRVAFYAEDAKEQKELLELLAQSLTSGKSLKKLEAKGVYLREGDVDPGRIAFMFPGQGSQYVHMLSELKERFPVVQETLEEADEIMAELLPRPLSSYISPAPDVDESTAFFELLQTEVLQPAVLTADYAMWRLLSPLMPVELVIGHSLGEYGAAVAAGVFSFADALRIVSARGEAIAAVADQMDDVGAMIGVGTDADTVEKLLAEMKDEGYVIVANKNCPTQTIIAGATQATMKAAENLEKLGYDTIQLPVSHAFHSDIVAPASPFLLKELEKIDVHPPKITILSNETATPYPTDENAPHWIRDTLSVHLARPVEWQAMIEWAYREGFHTFVEVGPKRALSSFVRDILVNQQHQSYFSSHPKFGELNSLGRMLAALTADGILPYGTEKPSIQARPKQTQTPNTPSHGLPYQHSTPKPPTSQPTPTFTIPTGSHPPAGSRDSSQPGVQVPGQRAQLPQQPSYSAPSYAPQESGSYTALPASPGAEGHTSQGTGYGWPIPSGAMQPSAYALPAVPPYQGHPWPPMPYGAPGYAPPMMPYAPTPHYPPPPYGYPMYNYPQPPLWQDPRFWQFVASQGPYLIQHLIASYQTVAPHLAPMRATPPAYVPAMPTYQHMPAVPATAPPVPPAAYQQPSGPTTPPPWAVSPQATYAAPAVAPPPPQKATPAAQPAPFNWGNGTSMPGATFPAPSTPVISPNIPTPAPSVETPQIELPAVSAEGDELETMILTLVADRTGYEVEELDLDEHLEADLGIDSIRQVEVMAELRDTLKLPRDDSFKITDYPTLRSLIAYVRQNIPGRQGREARSTGSGRDDTATSG